MGVALTRKKWTAGERARLREMRFAGAPVAAIAAALERTAESVQRKLRDERVVVADLLAGRRRMRWLDLLRRPHTIAAVAAEAGVKPHAVRQAKRRLRRLGFDVPAALREGRP